LLDCTEVTHPIDILSGRIADFMGLTPGDIDTPSWLAAKDNTPALALSGDLRGAGESFGELLARIGFESRINFWFSEQSDRSVLRADTPATDGTFPAATLTLTSFRRTRATIPTLTDRATEFSALFSLQSGISGSDVEAFRGILVAQVGDNALEADGVTTADLQAARANFGFRPAQPQLFILLDDEDSVRDVWGYYVSEAIRTSALRIAISIPVRVGYTLEPTDIVEFQPRWEDAPLKLRIVETIWQADSVVMGILGEVVL